MLRRNFREPLGNGQPPLDQGVRAVFLAMTIFAAFAVRIRALRNCKEVLDK